MLAGVAIHVDGRDDQRARGLRHGAAIRRPRRDRAAGDRRRGACRRHRRRRSRGRRAVRRDDQELLEALATSPRSPCARRDRWDASARAPRRSRGCARRRPTRRRAARRSRAWSRPQERERRRLAQDLHDRTAGGLTSVLFALRRLERELADDGQRAQLARGARGRRRRDRGRARSDRRPAAEGARRLRPRPGARAPVRDDRAPQRARRSRPSSPTASTACPPTWRPPPIGSCRRRSETSCAMPARPASA